MKWNKIDCTFNGGDFPLFAASESTGQVHYWRTLKEMMDNDPLWGLYTHWLPAAPYLPQPPPKPDKDKDNFDAWYCKYFGANGYPKSYLEVWRAALAHERQSK